MICTKFQELIVGIPAARQGAQICWNDGSNTTCYVLWSRYEETLKGTISVDLDVYIKQELLSMMGIVQILCSGISRGFVKGEVWFRGIWKTSTCKHVEVLIDDFWEGGVLDGSRGVLHASPPPDLKSGGGGRDFCGARLHNHNHLHPPILKSGISRLDSTDVGGLFGTGYLVLNRRYLRLNLLRIKLGS